MTELLGDLALAIVDCEHKTAPEGDGFAYSVGTKAMKDGRLVLEACKPVDAGTYEAWTRRMIPAPGDLVLAREAPVGQVVRVPLEPKLCLGQRTVLIRPDAERVDPRFLHYWLLGPEAQHLMQSQAAGATVPHLNVADIRGLDASGIPRDRRHQVMVGEVLSALDDLIENDRRRVGVLEEMARSIYREWFVHFRFPGHEDATFVDSDLGPIPEGWRASTCGAELSFVGGGTPSKKEPAYWDEGTVDWFTPTDLTKTGLRYPTRSELQITEMGLAKSSAKLVPPGTVMMTSRATLGVLAITTASASTNQGFISVLPDGRWPAHFVREFLAASSDDLAAIGTGATFKEITKGAFKSFPFLVPEQSVLDEYRAATSDAELLVASLEQAGSRLVALRDMLLPKLVTGQVDVSTLDLDGVVEKAGV